MSDADRTDGPPAPIGRRGFLGVLGGAGLASLGLSGGTVRRVPAGALDVLVIGAGVFGAWTARALHRAGKRVALVDAFGPAHGAASSGGESRVTRCGYGDAELYSEWACRSMAEWRALSRRAAVPLFHELGVLWLHAPGDEFVEATVRVFSRHGFPFSLLGPAELRSRYPVLRVADDEAGFLGPRGGGLMARRAVQQLVLELESDGVPLLHGEVEPIRVASGEGGALPAVRTRDGRVISAGAFVAACGPWLDRVCPDAMTGRLSVTRQEVLFFAVDRAATGALPVWADLPFYGLPSLEGRGFKVADDTKGPVVDVSSIDRRPALEAEERVRAFLERRFPTLAGSRLNESRVCQYESSSSGDFVLDRHPGLENVWLAGCGSGHGFKHGPAVGAHVAGLVLGTAGPIPRFGLAVAGARRTVPDARAPRGRSASS